MHGTGFPSITSTHGQAQAWRAPSCLLLAWGNPLLWSSARGKTLLEHRALQLSSSRARISMALQRKQPDSSLCSTQKRKRCSLCSGGSQAAFPGAFEASEPGLVYFVQCPLLFFLCLYKSPPDCIPWTGKVPGPGVQVLGVAQASRSF